MPRRGPAQRRELMPDPVYRSVLVTQLVNKVLLEGKKSTAERIVYDALEIVASKTDGDALTALKRAVEEARMRDASLEVVYVFSPPEQVTAFPVPPEKGTDRAVDVEEARAEANQRLGEWLDEIDVDLDGVDVAWTTIPDHRPARALVERSGDVDLVVVGSRGRGGFAGLKLGSVSEQVTRHAKSPVLVIRESTS